MFFFALFATSSLHLGESQILLYFHVDSFHSVGFLHITHLPSVFPVLKKFSYLEADQPGGICVLCLEPI